MLRGRDLANRWSLPEKLPSFSGSEVALTRTQTLGINAKSRGGVGETRGRNLRRGWIYGP